MKSGCVFEFGEPRPAMSLDEVADSKPDAIAAASQWLADGIAVGRVVLVT